ncbi:MAG: hypothetical protein PHF72_02105 [Gammaproteobacteria bacterium]|nr:hypothetical protein [Gammaproteobacteria bacterium]
MSADAASRPVLDAGLADFIQHHVSMNAAARDRDNRPTVARAYGCRVAPDRRRLTLLFPAGHCPALLACLAETGALAVVFSRPSTHMTIQLKGRCTGSAPASAADREVVEAYRATFIEELASLGYPPGFARAMVPPAATEWVAVGFAPETLYDQTPGPHAGRRVERGE